MRVSLHPPPQFGSFWTNGQICSSTSRLLIHKSISAAFLARLKLRAEAIDIGDPLVKGRRMGPVVSPQIGCPSGQGVPHGAIDIADPLVKGRCMGPVVSLIAAHLGT